MWQAGRLVRVLRVLASDLCVDRGPLSAPTEHLRAGDRTQACRECGRGRDLRLSSAQLLSVSEKSHEKIQSQYERHERQHKQRPITIAAHFWRGLATHEEEAKDTIAPRVHDSSIGEAHGILENARVLFFRRRW